jgi:hypothetical protein
MKMDGFDGMNAALAALAALAEDTPASRCAHGYCKNQPACEGGRCWASERGAA